MAVPKWMGFGRTKEEDDENSIEVKPPKEITDKLDKIDGIETAVNEFKAKSKVLDDMSAFLADQKQIKEDARAAEAAEKAKKVTIENQEEIDNLWLTDPKAAFEKQSTPLKIAALNAQSLSIRREIFDDASNYEYYIGEFKKEVDSLIDNSLNPVARIDPQSIKNCYDLVLGRKQKEIKEGKLKTRFSDMTTSSAKSGEGGKESEGEIKLSKEMLEAAAKLGVKPEDYAKNAREMGYV